MEYKIGFSGNLGKNHVNPRGLTSKRLNTLLSCKGIVTRITIVRPKLTKSVHWCDTNNKSTIRFYNDEYNLGEDLSLGLPNGYPLKDMEGNKLTPEFGYHQFKDF